MKIFILIPITAFFLTACSPASSDENSGGTDKTTPVSTAPVVATQAPVKTEASTEETTPASSDENGDAADKVAPVNTIQETAEATVLTEKIDNVTVEIQNVQKTNNQTILDIVMDNHIYDLSSMDVLNLSTLDGIKADDYQISKSIMGGHHINATMTFPGELSGPLIIGLNDELIFNFDI